jgi:hypothetical protein
MEDKISFSVTCPYCGQKIKRKKIIDFSEYIDDWDRILTDFDIEEFHCSCGERFLGAETVQSEKIGKIVNIAKKLRSEGKFDISENEIKIKLGVSDIWNLIREMKDLKGDFL